MCLSDKVDFYLSDLRLIYINNLSSSFIDKSEVVVVMVSGIVVILSSIYLR